MRRWLHHPGVIIGVAVSAVCLALFLWSVDARKLIEALRSCNYLWFIPAIWINILTMVFRALRWKHLLAPVRPARAWSLYVANIIGFMANNTLPARLGEIVRAYIAGRKERIPLSSCFASLIVERVYDMVCVLLMFAIVAMAGSFGFGVRVDGPFPPLFVKAGYLALATTAGLVAVLSLLKARDDLMLIITGWLTFFLPKPIQERVLRFQQQFVSGINFVQSPRDLAWAAFYSVVMWMSFAVCAEMIFAAFGITHYTIFHGLFLLVAIAFSIMIPAGPGFVGTYHYGCMLAITFMFGSTIPEGTAAGVAILMHLSGFIPVTLLGVVYMVLEGLSFRELQGPD